MVGALASVGELDSWIPCACRPCLGLCPRSSLPYFLLLSCYYSCVCFFLLLHPNCSHARGILCGIHTSCMWSLFPTAHAKWYVVFRSVNNSYWPKSALSLVQIITTTYMSSFTSVQCYFYLLSHNNNVGPVYG